MLTRNDITAAGLEKIAKSSATANSRKLKMALVEHSRTPRHVSRSVLRYLYTFDLMKLSLMPTVSADIKIAVEEALMNRVATI